MNSVLCSSLPFDKVSDLHDIFDLMLDAVCLVDRDGRFVFVNAAFTRIFGYEAEEVVGKTMSSLIFAPDRERTLKKVNDILAGELMTMFENRWVCKDGRVADVMWSARWSDEYQMRVAIGRDMSDYKQGQYKQAALYAIADAAHRCGDLSELLRQVHHFIDDWFPAVNFIVALRDHEKNAMSFPYVVVTFNNDLEACRTAALPLIESVMNSGQMQSSLEQVVPTHRYNSVAETHGNTLDALGIPLLINDAPMGVLVVQNNSTPNGYSARQIELMQFAATQTASFIQRKQMEAQLQFMAGHDALTKLPNRMLFLDRFKMALSLAQREGHSLALLFMDLDGFKQINDRHGHLYGDAVLYECARRLEKCVRKSDTITRFGGDEFIVLLRACNSGIDSIVEKILQALREPMQFDDISVSVSASVGIACYPEHGTTLDELIHHADKTMYAVKRIQTQQ